MPEVSVKVNGETVKMHVERLFRSRNPVTKKHYVSSNHERSPYGEVLYA